MHLALRQQTEKYQLVVNEILMNSTDKKAFSISASAQSLAGTRFQLNDLPHEDLLVFATGGGARSIGAEYEAASVDADLTKYEIRAVGENGNVIEIYDADTNHSIATRVVSGDQQTTYEILNLHLLGVSKMVIASFYLKTRRSK